MKLKTNLHHTMNKAVVLSSGGVDSTVALAWCIKNGFKVYSISFDYSQRHKKELSSAKKIARYYKVNHVIAKIKFPWKSSALLDRKMKLPDRQFEEIVRHEIPPTYVPARNSIFIAIAAGYLESINGRYIVIGANQIDYSGYPDCRFNYLKKMESALREGTTIKSLKILAPLIKMTKSEIVKLGLKLKVPFELTWSCYEGGKTPCGRCDSCKLRKKGFMEAGLEDPLEV